jgi:2-polyprenyl-6-methoxyphenol hydroxylase-like FAD-dependent oxidoreductase
VKVLIVGAGPTGLVLAHQLAQYGVECRLIERQRTQPKTSRAIGILPRTTEIFDLMRVSEDFLAAGRQIHAIGIFSTRPSSERIARIGLNRLDSPYPFALALPQDETERILEINVQRLGVTVERNMEIIAFDQDNEGVSARIGHERSECKPDRAQPSTDARSECKPDAERKRDSAQPQERAQPSRIDGSHTEEFRCDYVVGCDGAHSTVRHLLGMPFRGGRYKETVLLADIRVEGKIETDEAQVFLDPRGLTLFFPMLHAIGSLHRTRCRSGASSRHWISVNR